MVRPPRARAAVLDAAERVLLHRGADAFTLEAVAQEANVSKGGLLYHFPSKDALLQGIVERAVDAVDQSLRPAAESREPGAFARAYLESTIPAAPTGTVEPAADPLVAALVAAVAHDVVLLRPLRDAYRRWQARLEADGLDAGAATAVRLAADGWWLALLLGLPPLSAEVHARTRAVLDGLCRE